METFFSFFEKNQIVNIWGFAGYTVCHSGSVLPLYPNQLTPAIGHGTATGPHNQVEHAFRFLKIILHFV